MEFYIRAPGPAASLAILPGAFNPPTRAHIAMAEAALGVAGEVLFVLPRVFPHKQYTAAGLEYRLELLRAALAGNTRFSLGVSERGLFIDLAREARADYSPQTEIYLLCGRDAAERIVSWDYGEAEGIARQLESFRLLVAGRGGHYEPPEEIRDRVERVELDLAEISSSEVRRRIRAAEPWRELVPEPVVPLIEARWDIWAADERR
jgi:nicotinate (nicotinamide) nucleotide adenylyltransferase